MKREFWVTAVVIVFLLGSVVLKLFWLDKIPHLQTETAADRQTPANPSYPDVASFIAGRINDLSPSPSFDGIGWLATRILFSTSQPIAYVEYTDTHVFLRLLLEYRLSGKDAQTRVLATFVPVNDSGWRLQFGRDEGAGQRLVDYIYNGDSKQWISQDLIND